ncbi:MAG: isoprenyl transferase [Desulfobacteraceae bacterium]|nr:isoprenyl transferase [Desulfobacteraceae bacterium]
MSSEPSGGPPADLDASKLPAHIAIIMDGNGRWAKQRLLHRVKGHEKGAETVRNIVRACRQIGIAHLTLYAFSTENWQRPRTEIAALMHLLQRFLQSELPELKENNIRLRCVGQIQRLPAAVQEKLDTVMEATRTNDAMTLTLALSYGGRAEILRAARELARRVRDDRMDPDQIDERSFSSCLYTADLPDPDLLIRTSGEHRISNFLLWQIAYSEIFITDTLWPDFTTEEFIEILRSYQRRERRFGRVG